MLRDRLHRVFVVSAACLIELDVELVDASLVRLGVGRSALENEGVHLADDVSDERHQVVVEASRLHDLVVGGFVAFLVEANAVLVDQNVAGGDLSRCKFHVVYVSIPAR
ncbi:hypothetical protein [Denitromonas halophila]|uniref:hypothetical protein n=1 Tax=Denitromonas halophila TaxID=1629404 RepID=UPI001C90443D|nr:hypothetical protein [Denitromonas halophila]